MACSTPASPAHEVRAFSSLLPRTAINEDEIIARLHVVQLALEPGFAVIDGRGQFHVRIGQQDMRGDDIQVGNGGRVNGKGFAFENGGVERFLRPQAQVVGQQHLGGIGLAVRVYQQRSFALAGDSGGQRNGCGSLSRPSFLGGDRNDHSFVNSPKAQMGSFGELALSR